MLDKRAILDALLARLSADLDAITSSQRETQAGAVHEEARAEGDKDMRSTETSYLARGLAKRVEELRAQLAQLGTLALRSFSAGERIGLSAVVEVERDSGETAHYFLVPSAGGVAVELNGARITTVTPSSPLGRALLGRMLDDEVEIDSPQGISRLLVTNLH